MALISSKKLNLVPPLFVSVVVFEETDYPDDSLFPSWLIGYGGISDLIENW